MRVHKHIALAALAAVTVAAQARTSDETAIRKMYTKMASSFKSLSASSMIALEAPGYYEIDDGNKKTTEETNDDTKKLMGAAKVCNFFDLKIDSVKVKGITAKAKSTVHFEFTMKDKHTYEVWGTSEDNLVKGAKGWLVQNSVEKTTKIKMDGREIKPPKN
jgi:hypothetical protein